eukprot:1157982-Pelagomonas_calceolata.AAC.3
MNSHARPCARQQASLELLQTWKKWQLKAGHLPLRGAMGACTYTRHKVVKHNTCSNTGCVQTCEGLEAKGEHSKEAHALQGCPLQGLKQ